MDPIWMAFGGLVVSVLLYFGVVERGKRAERRRLADQDSGDDEQYQRTLADAKVEKYWNTVSRNYSSGIQALVMLGLYELDSDERVRDAIESMRLRTGNDPLSPHLRKTLEGVDLREFFRHVAERDIDFSKTSVSDVLASMKDSESSRHADKG